MSFSWTIPVGVALALVAALLLIADANSWSDSAVQWSIIGILGAITVVDLLVSGWVEKTKRRHGTAK